MESDTNIVQRASAPSISKRLAHMTDKMSLGLGIEAACTPRKDQYNLKFAILFQAHKAHTAKNRTVLKHSSASFH
jgi:hypothetical protein